MYFGAGAHGIPWGGSMGSQGGPLGTHWPLGPIGPWGPMPLGTHWPLGPRPVPVPPIRFERPVPPVRFQPVPATRFLDGTVPFMRIFVILVLLFCRFMSMFSKLSNAQQSCVPATALGVWLFVNRMRSENIELWCSGDRKY